MRARVLVVLIALFVGIVGALYAARSGGDHDAPFHPPVPPPRVRAPAPAPPITPPPAPAPVPAADPAPVSAAEEADVTVVMKGIMNAYAGQLVFCWESALLDHPDADGDVDLHLWIEGGKVAEVEVEDWTETDQVFTDCVASKVYRWDFSAMPDGEVTWPMKFRRDAD